MTTADIGSLTRSFAHDRFEVLSRAKPVCDVGQQEPTAVTDETRPTAEQVTGVIAGVPVIGRACEALVQAGWRASIAGNRITVNDEVLAQFIRGSIGRTGGVEATWVIYAIAGTPPVWVVGAEHQP
jgi:hypothetical protein